MRKAWADMVNVRLEEKGLDCRIDHRSYVDQGLDLIPTVHEGPHVRKMEKKGIRTEKGELNRWIKATNRMIRNIQATLAALKKWLAEAKAILKEPQEVYLAQLLSDAHALRNQTVMTYARGKAKAKKNNLKRFMNECDYLKQRGVLTLSDFEKHLSSVSDTVREYLGSVLESGGTGTAAKVEGYSMGGKTGTAQKIPRDAGTYLVSYIGFAPLDDPQVVVYVVVDEANSDNQSNSAYAQSIAKNIFTELLPYMNIFPDEGTASGTDTVGEPEQGIEDTSVPEPPASTQDETVESGGNDMLSDGITNSEQEITSG